MKVAENRLIDEFKDRTSFSRQDLLDFYRYFEPDLKEGTFGWRIYDLQSKNIIRPLKRGLYVISYKPKYKPEVSQRLTKLAKKIADEFEEAKYCIFDAQWLNEFSQHQAHKKMIVIEIEKELMEPLYYKLKGSLRGDLFLNPDEKVIDYYIAESEFPVVVKKLITRSPIARRTEKKVKFFIPLLEKVLVDLFADEKLFFYLQGSELISIYENAISSYAINFTRLFSYAKRRDREQEIKEFMLNHMYHLVNDIIE